MTLPRIAFLLLLMTLLLPWGAYQRQHGNPPDLLQVQADQPHQVAVAKAPCKTATLPGTLCSPDLALIQPAAHLQSLAASLRPRKAPQTRLSGRNSAPPRAPPRLA